MKKRILCLTLALLISGAQVVSVSATREDEAALQQEMDATNEQLNATYSRLDELSAQKSQIEGEISTLDANLVNVMVSIQTLEGDISNKEADIASTQANLEKAKNAKTKQYEAMKKRIQYLYEKGGDDASKELSVITAPADETRPQKISFAEISLPIKQESVRNGFQPDIIIRKGAVSVEISNSVSAQLLSWIGDIFHAE